MKKQTAVEWLLQRFEDGDMYNVEDTQFIKHQALAMEKDQIIQAACYEPWMGDLPRAEGENYYRDNYVQEA